jgi:hypothetical protein
LIHDVISGAREARTRNIVPQLLDSGLALMRAPE